MSLISGVQLIDKILYFRGFLMNGANKWGRSQRTKGDQESISIIINSCLVLLLLCWLHLSLQGSDKCWLLLLFFFLICPCILFAVFFCWSMKITMHYSWWVWCFCTKIFLLIYEDNLTTMENLSLNSREECLLLNSPTPLLSWGLLCVFLAGSGTFCVITLHIDMSVSSS